MWGTEVHRRDAEDTEKDKEKLGFSSHIFIVDLRINGTLQTGAVRKTKLPFSRLVGAVSNCADSVRLKTAPTGGRKCSSVFNIHHS